MWTALVFLVVASAVSSSLQQAADSSVTVRTEDGLLRGNVATSLWNRTYTSFQNVPFAQPPVGDLRFKSPKPVKPWTGVRDAQKQGPYCSQSTNFGGNMSEDCLYLNVYVPQVAASAVPTKGLSVLVWIHGGGYTSGSGIREMYGPDNFMNGTVIIVTVNYRLGALGFLSMEHPDMTSNAGMKDQVAALCWVKRNIQHFGGNPDDVTVFGESAGAMSVDLLLLSDMSRGLFHRAISQSGSAVSIPSIPDYNGTRGVFRLGEVLGHKTTDADNLVKFLRSIPVEDILNATSQAMAEADGVTIGLVTYPTIDAKVQEGHEVFLVDDPEKLLRQGKSIQVPYITGINSNEGKATVEGLTQATLDYYNNDPEQFIPSTLYIKRGTPESKQLAAKIKNFYFGNKTISFDTLQELSDLLSDNFMIYTVYRGAMLHIKYGSAPLYMYLFTYDGNHVQVANRTIKGPGHGEDLTYLFYVSYVQFKYNNDSIAVIRHFTNMWEDFATHGDPSLRESVKWTAATKTNHNYLQIDVQLSLQNTLKERMAFWDSVYDTYKK